MSIIKHVSLEKIVAHDFRYDHRITGQLPIGEPYDDALRHYLEPTCHFISRRYKRLFPVANGM